MVLALYPRRPSGQPLMVQPDNPRVVFNQAVHFVGTLSKDFSKFESLSVIRQSNESMNEIEEYKKRI